jgi:hypothetical protein
MSTQKIITCQGALADIFDMLETLGGAGTTVIWAEYNSQGRMMVYTLPEGTHTKIISMADDRTVGMGQAIEEDAIASYTNQLNSRHVMTITEKATTA